MEQGSIFGKKSQQKTKNQTALKQKAILHRQPQRQWALELTPLQKTKEQKN